MKRLRQWLLLTALLVLPWLSCAAAQEDIIFSASVPTGRSAVQIHSTLLNEEHWLFLPSFANLSSLHLSCSEEGLLWPWGDGFENGKAVDAPKALEETEAGVYSAVLTHADQTLRLNITRSANLRTLFFYSDDPVNQGREWIDNCTRHENETTGFMALVSQTGTVDHADRITRWRGRGNSTWYYPKKPYQFKLEYKADLLKTGIPSERNRTWVLRSDESDSTLLHDQIAMDLGLEMGVSETGFTEHVDFYYDGEYRGIYLLCEKAEVNEGRIEVLDYDKLIEQWNNVSGQTDLDALPVAQGTNAYGLPFTYIEGLVDNPDPVAGGYLIELEGGFTLSDKCHFTLSDGFTFALKSPEYASADMVAYISEKMELLLRTLENHGVDPETGVKTEDIMDLESFARVAMIHDFTNNIDGYSWSSSFFVLPAGKEKFRAGPLLDFDLSFGVLPDLVPERFHQFKKHGWLQMFYSVPAFRDICQNIVKEELIPFVDKILLGEEHGRYLKPLDEYASHIETAMIMNRRLWSVWSNMPADHPSIQTDALRKYIVSRLKWFEETVMAWDQQNANLLEVEANTVYLLTEQEMNVHLQRWSNGEIKDWTVEQLTEATEEDYAVWQFTATFEPVLDFSFTEDTRVVFNGAEALTRFNEDGTLTATVLFEDPSYKPVYAYDEDIGMVFNYDYYISINPDVAEEWDYDPMFIAEYFYDYGMEEGQRGNVFFRPASVMADIPSLEEEIGYYLTDYYWAFIEGAYEEWMPLLDERYEPEPLDPQSAAQLLADLGQPWEE